MPIFTAIFATVFLRERFNRSGWYGSAFSLAGVAVIALGQPGGLLLGAGASLILGAAMCCAAYFAPGYFGAARAANFLYLTPAVATALSIVLSIVLPTALTGERPGPATLCGGLMAIAGVGFVALRGRR
nr:hypothetical protein [Trinickia terrae]